jgi:glycerophosphoryl diester phosphodiesterase
VSPVLSHAWADLRSCWRPLAGTVLLYTALATVVLLPMIGMVLRLLIARTHGSAVADVDIARFFFTTAPGVVGLILVSALLAAVTALEQACLMSVGLGQARGKVPRVRDAFAHAAARTVPILGLTLQLMLRLLILIVPFAIVSGAAYWGLLRRYDINYYLAARPPEFWAAAAIIGAAAVACAMSIVKKAVDWLLILPLILFENTSPTSSFSESARRIGAHRRPGLLSLAAWALLAIVLPVATTPVMQALGRWVAPAFGESMPGMLSFVGVIAVIWLIVAFILRVFVGALFALICVRWYVATAPGADLALPRRLQPQAELGGDHRRVSWLVIGVVLLLAVPVAAGVAYALMQNVWTDRPVLVIAHRGASEDAPENTLAAFRRAGVDHADYVELDVQESSDGVVLVAHDSDLMKVAHVPLKIWSSTAAQLRAVDIGSYYSSAYADQRVPTLAEALAVCKGVSHVAIELKDYGHNQRLEERVIGLVEAAGMEHQIVTMSLSRAMVAKMKLLRPSWTSGLLIAKAIGDIARLPVDFLAVESSLAQRELIRSAHGVGKPVYVWTVNDPERMIRLMGLGVDGLITNRPALGKEIVAEHASMSPAQRLFLFVMTRLGVRAEVAEPAGELRP